MPAQTIFVGSLPASASNELLEEIFSEIGPVKQCFVVREKGTEKCRGFGYVTYSMEEDAQRALKEIKEYDGRRLSLSVAKKKIKDKKKTASKEPAAAPKENEQKSKGFRKKQLKARLIIRNLSFKCSEDDLKQVFAKCGTVLEAKIPLKPDGKKRGFAFVLFKNVTEAARALKALNLKEIKGRQVAVDWAVSRDQFIATQPSSSAGNKNIKEETTKQSDTESDDKDEDDEETQAAPELKKVASKPAVQQVEESQSDDYEDDSEEQDSEEEDDDVSLEREEDDDDDDDNDDDNDDNSSLDSNEQDESEDDEEDEDDDEEDELAQRKASRKLLSSDVKEGRTVFIRNLSFDTDEEGLEEVLLRYGELNYVKVVVNTETEHSKGCAFAQFKTKEAADRCMAAAQDEAENGGIRVHGRKLFIVAAVTREDAAKLKVSKVKIETGTRNLYLAREGLIRAGTKAAEGVPEVDMIKRARFEDIKRDKLRNINVFVSKTRLCIHNLPKSLDSKKLKTLCLQAAKGNKDICITECRVMYDKKPVKGQVMGQSLGFGFVQFQRHEDALSTLRYLNNNPNIFGSHKRPIVEFSLEDSRKLQIKEMRQQKNKAFSRNQPFKGGVKPQYQTAGDGKGPRRGGNRAQWSSEQAGNKRAPPQHQKQDRRYSGFQTNPEVEHVDLENGKKRRKVLALPSHRGPKIRMRDKGKQQAPPPNKARPGSNRKERRRQQMEKPTQPRNQVKTAKKHFKSRDGDRFDSLVKQYKKKLMGNIEKSINMKRNKWFDS